MGATALFTLAPGSPEQARSPEGRADNPGRHRLTVAPTPKQGSPSVAHFGDKIDDHASLRALLGLLLGSGQILGIAAAVPDGALEIVSRQAPAINLPAGG